MTNFNDTTEITEDAFNYMIDDLEYEVISEQPLVFEKTINNYKDTVKDLAHLRQTLESNGFKEEVVQNVYIYHNPLNGLR